MALPAMLPHVVSDDEYLAWLSTYIIGVSPAIHEIRRLLVKIRRSEMNIVVEGRTGTGKDLILSALHAGSLRADRLFIDRCFAGDTDGSATSSQIFGHVIGAFTGAVKTRLGAVGVAVGATLALSDINLAPPDAQAMLLRFIQEGWYEPLGADETKRADVRLLFTSNVPLLDEVAAGRFREDLYYRMKVLRIEVPSLAERPEDIPICAEHFQSLLRTQGRPSATISLAAMAVLVDQPWRGNARELKNAIEAASALAEGGIIAAADVRRALDLEVLPCTLVPRDRARLAVKMAKGNLSRAAKALGVSRRQLGRLVEVHT
jgi:DNA-binding NtrC family response regulator